MLDEPLSESVNNDPWAIIIPEVRKAGYFMFVPGDEDDGIASFLSCYKLGVKVQFQQEKFSADLFYYPDGVRNGQLIQKTEYYSGDELHQFLVDLTEMMRPERWLEIRDGQTFLKPVTAIQNRTSPKSRD